jgi:DNA-binding NarL/FixJ family response regulator
MNNNSAKKNVLICDTQPVAVEGMKWLIENSGDLRFVGSVHTLEAAWSMLRPGVRSESDPMGLKTSVSEKAVEITFAAQGLPTAISPSVHAVVVDKALGMNEVIEWLRQTAATGNPTPTVVWGSSISESEALKLLQSGAKGILKRTSESGTLLACLRAVTAGGTWMEDGIFGSTEKLYNPKRSQLTARENEVAVLVEQGLRNRDIARNLGIQTGTVKIHLKHIFEKTGVRGRYGLALTGLQNKGSITLLPPQYMA